MDAKEVAVELWKDCKKFESVLKRERDVLVGIINYAHNMYSKMDIRFFTWENIIDGLNNQKTSVRTAETAVGMLGLKDVYISFKARKTYLNFTFNGFGDCFTLSFDGESVEVDGLRWQLSKEYSITGYSKLDDYCFTFPYRSFNTLEDVLRAEITDEGYFK